MVHQWSRLRSALLATAVLSLVLLACSQSHTASNYPTRPISYMVPWTAGGPLGTTVQVMAWFLELELNQPVQVVFRPGASGQVGLTEFAATAKPDGYFLAGYNSPSTEATYLDPDRKTAYNRASFAPVAVMGVDPSCYAVTADSRFKSIGELVQAAREKPESVVSADGGLLSEDHLSLLMLQKKSGARFAMVHFEGGAPTSAALHGGHVDFMAGNIGDVMSAYKTGVFRVLAVAAEERHPMLPDVPTLKEQGIDMVSYVVRGTVAPAGTSSEIIGRLESAIKRVDAMPEYRARMTAAGLPARFMGSAEYESYLKSEEDRVGQLLKELR